MNKYRVNRQHFEKISEAKKAARMALIGRSHSEIVQVYEWQETSDEFGGFWEPVATAEYKKGMIICK